MNDQRDTSRTAVIFAAQFVSLLLMWIFVLAITVWIINLILLSIELDDVPGASVAISIVAIPVFVTLASVLTYVFVGLQRARLQRSPMLKEEEHA